MYIQSANALQKLLDKSFEVEQKRLLTAGVSALANLFMQTMTKTGVLNYAWLGDIPNVREFIGSKMYSSLKDINYSISTRDWYNALSIHKKALKRDELDSIRPRIAMMVQSLVNYKAEIIIDFIVNGTTYLAYDGQPYFSNRANDNLLAGSGITIENIETDITTARQTAMKYQTENGRFMRVVLDTVICPPEMEMSFRKIKNAPSDPSQTNPNITNPYSSMIGNIVVLPELSDTNDWYYICTTHPLKPFILVVEQQNNGKEVESMVDETKLKSDGIYGYSAEMSANGGYGFPELAVKIVNS